MKENVNLEIAVPLLDEGTQASRKTPAKQIGVNLYQIFAADNYNPEDEIWEFLPGSIVRCEIAENPITHMEYLRAVEVRNEDGSFRRSEIFPEYMSVSVRGIAAILCEEDIEGLIATGAPGDEYNSEAEHISKEVNRIYKEECNIKAVMQIIAMLWLNRFDLSSKQIRLRMPAMLRVAQKIIALS